MKIGDKTEGQILAEVIAAMVPGKSYRSRQLAEITGHGAASVQYVLRRAVARLVEVHHHMENRLNLCSLPAGARGTSAADGGTPSAPPRRELTFDTDWKAFRGGGASRSGGASGESADHPTQQVPCSMCKLIDSAAPYRCFVERDDGAALTSNLCKTPV